VDRNRVEDYDKIRAEIRGEMQKLGKLLATPPPLPKKSGGGNNSDSDSASEKPAKPEKAFEYVVQRGDTLLTIIQACREQKGVKVTAAQIQKANPGLKPERLLVGQKILIPVP
jgi:LysM repeat protein